MYREGGMLMEPTIFEMSVAGRKGVNLPELDVPLVPPAELIGEENSSRKFPNSMWSGISPVWRSATILLTPDSIHSVHVR
jgi:hypothetical protein